MFHTGTSSLTLEESTCLQGMIYLAQATPAFFLVGKYPVFCRLAPGNSSEGPQYVFHVHGSPSQPEHHTEDICIVINIHHGLLHGQPQIMTEPLEFLFRRRVRNWHHFHLRERCLTHLTMQ